jgi:hypothetical protein
VYFFFGGEGPRSRCYGRTAALRLIVQPCDEDEEKDDQFLSFFQVMGQMWNEIDREKSKYSGKNLSQCMRVLFLSSSYVLNFILPACKRNFAEVARTISMVERAWSMFFSQSGTKFNNQTEKYVVLTDRLTNKQ